MVHSSLRTTDGHHYPGYHVARCGSRKGKGARDYRTTNRFTAEPNPNPVAQGYFYDTGDFGEVYARNASGASWVLLKEWFTSEKKLSGNSGGFFEDRTYYLAPELCSENTQIRFRMKSNSEGVGEGWYVDDVETIDITGFGSFNNFAYAWLGYTDGHTESAWRWTSFADWTEAIELSDPELAPYRGEVIDEIHFSCGDDVYGFEVCDYRLWVVDGALPALPITLTPDATGVTSGTGWDYVTIVPHDIPASGSVFVIIEWSNYDEYQTYYEIYPERWEQDKEKMKF